MRHRGHPQGLPRLGRALRQALFRHVRFRDLGARQRTHRIRARPPRHQAPLSRRDAVLVSFKTAVERRRIAAVPVGVLLSGGLDSSLVVALLAEAGHSTDLKTFSIGFDSVGDVAGDEFRYSDLVARRFGTDHCRIRIDGGRALSALPGAVASMSEPMVSHDTVAFYLLSEEVSKHVKVVQSGQGPDEIF